MKNFIYITGLLIITFVQACVAQNYDGIKMYKCNPNNTVTKGIATEIYFFFNREITDELSVNLNSDNAEITYEIDGEKIIITTIFQDIGINTITGNIQLKKGDEIIKEFEINEEFIVVEPNTVVINIDNNKELKLNQTNKLEISVAGIPPHKLEVTTNNGEVIKEGAYFIITPNRKGECKIFISGQLINGSIYETEYQFNVK